MFSCAKFICNAQAAAQKYQYAVFEGCLDPLFTHILMIRGPPPPFHMHMKSTIICNKSICFRFISLAIHTLSYDLSQPLPQPPQLHIDIFEQSRKDIPKG